MSHRALKIVTIFASLLIFTGFQAFAMNQELMDFYEQDDRYEFFLTEEKADQCDELYGEWPKTLRMCYRVSSRDQFMSVDKIRACHRNFYWVYDIRNCLKFAPLIDLQEINDCGKVPSHRYRPMKGMTCIGEAVGVWRIEYEQRIFKD